MNGAKTAIRERLRGVLALAVCAGVFSACAGENLFSVVGSVGHGGPEVEITSPVEGAESEIGDSILVQTTVSSDAGAASAAYSGVYEVDGSVAFQAESADLNGLSSVQLTNFLRAAPGQVAGTAVIIVSVTDLAGSESADSVTITITEPVTN